MYLSRLRLMGFKSFYQETDISFEPGITSVVGPNGCGKSNVCDAIRWVLGEQGHRSLRAERMEDIIFNGNGAYPPLGMAEVSLTIAAHEGQLPTEFSEITVSRRLFRSGESEYFLNGAPCLLRDILNLFLDSGLGNTPYALIEQGALASVIEIKPGERKAMIEEAAGIMKYKLRKRAAVAKLGAAEENLSRLGDIINEVEQQRNSLNRQAKRAREYEELREGIEYLEGYLRFENYQRTEAEAGEVSLGLRDKSDEKASLAAQVLQVDGQRELERIDLLKLDGLLQETQNSLYRLKGEIEKVSGQFEMLVQEGGELREAEEKIHAELGTASSQIEQLQKVLAEERKRGEVLGERMDSLSLKRKELQEKKETLSQELDRLSRLLEEKRREAFQAAALCSGFRNQCLALENQDRKLIQQAEKLKSQNESLSSEIAHLREKDTSVEAEMRGWASRCSEWESKRAEIATSLASTTKEQEDVDLALTRWQRQVGEYSSRLESYEDLQRSYLGYGAGAQFLLQQRNASEPLETGSIRTLTEIVETTAGCEKAIEALLGAELQGLVMDSLEEARRAIQELESRKEGGATFLPLSFPSASEERKVSYARSEDFPPSSGIIGRAIDLIVCEPRYEGLVRQLLSDDLVVEDLKTALEVFGRYEGVRAVATLRGEVVTPRGSIRLPSHSSFGLLVRQREIKDLRGRVRLAREELKQVQTRREVLGQLQREIKATAETLEKEGQSLQIERVTLEKDRRQLGVDLEKIGQQEEINAIELRATEEEIAQVREELSASSREQKEQEQRQTICEREIGRLQNSVEALRTQHQQLLKQDASGEEELRSQEEERREKATQIARKEEQVNSFLQRKEQLQRELVAVQQRRSAMETSSGEKERILSELGAQEAEINKSLAEIANQRSAVSLRLSQSEEKVARLRRQISEVEGSLGELQIRKAQIEQSLHYLRQGLSGSEPSEFAQRQARYQEEKMQTSVAQDELLRHQERCRRLEPVNMAALADYEALSKRFLFLNSQAHDLRSSVSSLRQAISEINKTTQRLFGEAFRSINQYFEEYCGRLFGGGTAEIRLQRSEEEGEEQLGVEMMVSPPGKHLSHLDLFSGGEKALAALAFLLALFKYRPTPFCLLDEVDAPLDDANIERFVSLIKEFSQEYQFILITHNKKTMEAADSLYGITMEEPGISKVMSVRFDENGTKRRKGDEVESLVGGRHGNQRGLELSRPEG